MGQHHLLLHVFSVFQQVWNDFVFEPNQMVFHPNIQMESIQIR